MSAVAKPVRAEKIRRIGPQRGPQESFLSSSADIAIYGGAAGGGKTFGILLEPVRHVAVPGFGGVIFRREHVQITNQGGLWDEAVQLYPLIGGRPYRSPQLGFRWPRSKITFSHLNREDDVLAWQGAQIAFIGFDELTHFTESQFWYMLSRNRSTCGVRPYIRATTNPDADSWVKTLIGWWLDKDGFPIPDRGGVLRWFVRVSGELHWGDSPDIALEHGMQREDAKSLTFIPARVQDNQELLQRDPGYLANLRALSRVSRGRLLDGNWNIRPAAGMYFRRDEVRLIDAAPVGTRWIRAWDLAATEQSEEARDPDWSRGVKLGRTPSGRWVVGNMASIRDRAGKVRRFIRQTAEVDSFEVGIAIFQDPAQAGKGQAEQFVQELSEFPIRAWPITGDKVTLADPFSAQWQQGNVDVVRGPWNEAFFDELEAFPPKKGHDDQVDACSLGYYAHTHDFRPTESTTTNVSI